MSVHRRVILESEDEEEGSAESQEIATQEIATQESEEPEYEVEEIIKHRHNRKGVLEYFVKWRGFEHDDDSWVPVENMADGPLIRDYNEKHDVGKKKRSRSRSAYVNKSRGTRAVSRDLTRSPSPLSTRDLSPEETLPQAKNRRRALDPKASYFEKSRAPLIRLATGRPLTPQNSSKECTPEPEASESNVTTRNKRRSVTELPKRADAIIRSRTSSIMTRSKTPEAPSRAKNLRSITTYCTDEARSKTPEPPPSTRKRRSVTTIPTEKKKNPENSMRSRTTSTLRSASVSSQAENSRNLDAIMQASTEPPLVIDEEPQTSIYDQEVDDLAEIRDIPDTRPTGTIIEGIEVYESNGRMVVRTTKPGRKERPFKTVEHFQRLIEEAQRKKAQEETPTVSGLPEVVHDKDERVDPPEKMTEFPPGFSYKWVDDPSTSSETTEEPEEPPKHGWDLGFKASQILDWMEMRGEKLVLVKFEGAEHKQWISTKIVRIHDLKLLTSFILQRGIRDLLKIGV